jgi:hypothetical protein
VLLTEFKFTGEIGIAVVDCSGVLTVELFDETRLGFGLLLLKLFKLGVLLILIRLLTEGPKLFGLVLLT